MFPSTLLRLLRWLALLAAPALAIAQPGAPIVVGATVAESGVLSDFGAEYRKGLVLWQEQANAAGGLLGRKVELRLLNDASDAVGTGTLYQRLIREGADVLIGPFGSAGTLTAAAEADRSRRVFLNAAGASRAVHKRSPRYVFQTTPPYGAYAEGALAIARSAGIRKLYIVHRADPVSAEMAEVTLAVAARAGLEARGVNAFNAGTSEFEPFIDLARSEGAEAWIAFASFNEAGEMVKSFKRAGYAPRLFYASDADDPRLLHMIGQDAEHALATVEYQAGQATPGNAAFASAYRQRWGAAPRLPAAQAFAAGTVLADAVKRAGSTEQEALRAALAATRVATVLGEVRFDPATGERLGAEPALVQIHRGRPAVVWPAALASRAAAPYPAWSERILFKSEKR